MTIIGPDSEAVSQLKKASAEMRKLADDIGAAEVLQRRLDAAEQLLRQKEAEQPQARALIKKLEEEAKTAAHFRDELAREKAQNAEAARRRWDEHNAAVEEWKARAAAAAAAPLERIRSLEHEADELRRTSIMLKHERDEAIAAERRLRELAEATEDRTASYAADLEQHKRSYSLALLERDEARGALAAMTAQRDQCVDAISNAAANEAATRDGFEAGAAKAYRLTLSTALERAERAEEALRVRAEGSDALKAARRDLNDCRHKAARLRAELGQAKAKIAELERGRLRPVAYRVDGGEWQCVECAKATLAAAKASQDRDEVGIQLAACRERLAKADAVINVARAFLLVGGWRRLEEAVRSYAAVPGDVKAAP